MSKIYRCIDCGKEYKFDFSEINPDEENIESESFQQKISDYVKILNFPSESNICYECLRNIKNFRESTIKPNKKKDLENISKQYMNDLNEKYKKDENILKNLTEEEEQQQLKELNDIKNKVEQNESELNLLLKELENIEQKETEFCNEFRDLEIKLYFAEKDISKANDIKLDYENKIRNFSNNNIFSELFQISFGDKHGCINGCKFGDPYNSNNYDSINGGWGYIILLTKLLAVKYMFESCKYDLIPEGNFSKIMNKDTKDEYEIGISDINRTKDKFNRAMDAYLDYLNEFLNYLIKNGKIEIVNEDICPKINGKKINNKSILIENKDNIDNWYQSMKYLLTILKFLICQVLINENQSYKNIINNTGIKTNNANTNSISSNK